MREGPHSAADRDENQETGNFIANLLGTLDSDLASSPITARSGDVADPFQAAQNQDLFLRDADAGGGRHDGQGHGETAAGPAETLSAAVKTQSHDASAATPASAVAAGNATPPSTAPALPSEQDPVTVAIADQAADDSGTTPPTGLPKGSRGHAAPVHRAKSASGGAGTAAAVHAAAAGPAANALPLPQPAAMPLEGNGAGSTFVFQPGFGQETLQNLLLGGADHDTVALPSADFANFAQMLNSTQDTANGAVIHDTANGDTLLLAGVTKAEITQAKADFTFHG